ncbi:MAG: hypothetical protein IPF98_18965 [Gemmatimonadetes bacterium]|nr:hypothetical protein [Gemmatimonadota bacterium]MCC6772175.1 hypothetical protein [Gemmatimonadaceae bacterium]
MTRQHRSRSRLRRVDSKDTATTPLPGRFSARRLWQLLGLVVLLAIAALLVVYRG